MAVVYQVYHYRIGPADEEDVTDAMQMPQHGGFYSTEANARAAIERAKDRPEFRAWPGGFRIYKVTLDVDHWHDGFVSWDDT